MLRKESGRNVTLNESLDPEQSSAFMRLSVSWCWSICSVSEHARRQDVSGFQVSASWRFFDRIPGILYAITPPPAINTTRYCVCVSVSRRSIGGFRKDVCRFSFPDHSPGRCADKGNSCGLGESTIDGSPPDVMRFGPTFIIDSSYLGGVQV